jgi:hypothetical protein
VAVLGLLLALLLASLFFANVGGAAAVTVCMLVAIVQA